MTKKIRFYLDNLESDIFIYDDTDESWESDRDQDQLDWIFANIDSSWSEIGHDIQCNNCNWTGFEEDLVEYNETSKVDNITLEYFKGCPNCKTDEYLMDI